MEENNKSHKQNLKIIFQIICTIALIGIFTAIVFMVKTINFKINNIFKLARDAGFTKSYIYTNTDFMEKYCSETKYIPYLYINKFKKAFAKTEEYADSVIVKLAKDYDVDLYKELEKGINENIVYIEEYFSDIQIENKMSKRDFCEMFDRNSDTIIKDKIEYFKQEKPNVYLD